MNGRNIDQDNGTPPENAGGGTNYRKNRVSEDCKRLSSASGDEMMSREEYCYRRNLSVGFWLAIVIAIINIYWMFDAGYKGAYGPLRFVAFAVGGMMSVSSIMVIVAARTKLNRNIKLHKRLQLYYQITTVIEAALFAMVRGQTIVSIGGAENELYRYTGVSIMTLNLFTITFYPLPKARDAAIVLTLMFASGIVPEFVGGGAAYDIASQVVIRLMVAAVYMLARRDALRMADNYREITATHRKLAELAYRDGLTGLYNFRAMTRYLRFARKEPQIETVGVIIVDVDEFKNYNDRYSHSAGNIALCRISERLGEILNGQGLELFRYGGEEFVIFTDNFTEKELLDLACEIRASVVDLDIEHDGTDRGVLTITCGVAMEPGSELDDKDFVVRADRQLYLGKGNGRNCVVYEGRLYAEGE